MHVRVLEFTVLASSSAVISLTLSYHLALFRASFNYKRPNASSLLNKLEY